MYFTFSNNYRQCSFKEQGQPRVKMNLGAIFYKTMEFTIIILPMLNFLVLSLFGRYLGHVYGSSLAVASMWSNTFLSFYSFYYVGLLGNYTYMCLGT